jgi:PAS domain S-box-containing protein
VKSEKNSIISDPAVQSILYNSIPQMLTILDENNNIIWQNKRIADFLGRTITGESFKDIFSINPEELNNPKLKALSTVSDKKGMDKILEHSIIHHSKKDSPTIKIVITDDITEKIGNDKLLGFLLEFESLLTRLALESINIHADDIDSHLNKLLLLTGKFANVERCFVALFNESGEEICIANDWCAPGFTPTIKSLKTLHLPRSWIRKKKSEVIVIPDIEKIKYHPDAGPESVFSRGIHSSMLIPLFNKNKRLGYIGFSSTRTIDYFTPELKSIFRITAELAVNLYERKSAYTQISISEKIISKSSGMLAFFDKNGIIKTTNESFRKFHSLTEAETENLQIQSLFRDKLGTRENKLFEYINSSLNGEEIQTEIWYKDKERLRLLEIALHPNIDSDGKIGSVILNSNDITDRVQLEARILEVIHTERKKIGISLHDDLGHDLLAVAIKSRLIADKLKSVSPEMSVEVNEIENAIKNAINEVRRLSHGLIPYKNHGLEFKEMIDAVALTIERDYKLQCEFQIDESVYISDESIIKEIYYIIDEAVMNTLKHSGCTGIKITMAPKDKMISLSIIDNGCGMSEDFNAESGVGLEIMKYRARAIGGFLEAKNHPGGGAMIECIFNPEKIKL